MTLEERIKKLPEAFQPLALAHLPMLREMIDYEILAWIDMLLDGDYMKAYKVTNGKMSFGQKADEQERLNNLYKSFIGETVKKNEALRRFFRSIILIAIQMFIDKND